MKSYLIYKPGSPEELKLEEIPTPKAEIGKILIQIKAFGLNRSEYFTRLGHSPNVRFPRVLGIECVGLVQESKEPEFPSGTKVAAFMGGMGREFNGSYAEYTLVPKSCLKKIESNLPWEKLGAFPEMLQTTHGSLYKALEIERAKTLLIRGGTSSIGLCALAIAKKAGLEVISTTRNPDNIPKLKSLGADHVILEKAEIKNEIKSILPKGVDRVLELIGASTLIDSLHCTREGGITCMTGILGGGWVLEQFAPMESIPNSVKLTIYSGGSNDISDAKLNSYIRLYERGELQIELGKVYAFSDLVQAHHDMDNNKAGGKQVVMI